MLKFLDRIRLHRRRRPITDTKVVMDLLAILYTRQVAVATAASAAARAARR